MKQKETTQVIRSALLIEDDQICQRIIIANLSKLGFVVDAVNDATTAINKLKEISYNLIVTDLRLPDKLGDEVIKAARLSVLNQAAPLIVGSAQLNKNDFKTYLDLGADAVLTKPYSYEKLAETIKNCYLIPGYQRKFFYQIKNSLNKFQQDLEAFLKTNGFQALSTNSQRLLKQSLHLIKDYQPLITLLRNFLSVNEYQKLISNLHIFINESIAALKEYQQWPKIDKNNY